MLLVKTKIGPSKISGIGLFADEFIPKGTPVWKFQSGFDLVIPETQLTHLSDSARKIFLNYAYREMEGDTYVLCFDDARFFNHSEDPNVNNLDPLPGEEWGVDVASRDIMAGEELTENYKEFDVDFDYKFENKKFLKKK